jgi:hypothetical protein
LRTLFIVMTLICVVLHLWISDAGLKHLAALQNLKELTIIPIDPGQLGEPACAVLRASLPGCRVLSTLPIPFE